MLDEIPYAATEPIFLLGISDRHDRMERLDLWSKLDILANAIFLFQMNPVKEQLKSSHNKVRCGSFLNSSFYNPLAKAFIRW